MQGRFIVEENLFKLKGVVGILHAMGMAETEISTEIPDSFILLEGILRDVCEQLQPIVDGEVE